MSLTCSGTGTVIVDAACALMCAESRIENDSPRRKVRASFSRSPARRVRDACGVAATSTSILPVPEHVKVNVDADDHVTSTSTMRLGRAEHLVDRAEPAGVALL